MDTLCWSCKHAVRYRSDPNPCMWAWTLIPRYDWEAEETNDSYIVKSCPGYEWDGGSQEQANILPSDDERIMCYTCDHWIGAEQRTSSCGLCSLFNKQVVKSMRCAKHTFKVKPCGTFSAPRCRDCKFWKFKYEYKTKSMCKKGDCVLNRKETPGSYTCAGLERRNDED